MSEPTRIRIEVDDHGSTFTEEARDIAGRGYDTLASYRFTGPLHAKMKDIVKAMRLEKSANDRKARIEELKRELTRLQDIERGVPYP